MKYIFFLNLSCHTTRNTTAGAEPRNSAPFVKYESPPLFQLNPHEVPFLVDEVTTPLSPLHKLQQHLVVDTYIETIFKGALCA